MRCDRCDHRVSKASSLEQMPNGDFVCRKCSEAEEKAVAETFRDAYIVEQRMKE